MHDIDTRTLKFICQNYLTGNGTRNSAEVRQVLDSRTDGELAEALLQEDRSGLLSTCSITDIQPVLGELRADFPVWMAAAG